MPLLQALNDRDPDVRLAAARSLGRLRPRSAAGPLLYALVQGLVPRAVAANALISIGAAALPGIRNLLADEEPAARASAVELLGRLGNPRDSVSLRERLGDDAPLVRRRACEALARLGADDACDALEELLADTVADVRISAAEALAAVGDERSAPTLLRLVHHDDVEVAEVAARALTAVAPGLVVELGGDLGAHPQLRHAASLIEAGVA
jgi:HEAT repeat protein